MLARRREGDLAARPARLEAPVTTERDAPVSLPSVNRMASNAIVQAAAIPFQSLISLGTFAVITRHLGPGGFGDYTAVMVFLFLPTVIADVGLSAIVLRDVAAAPERMREIINASISLRIVISLVAVGLAAALAFVVPLDHRARIGVLVGSPGAFLTLMNVSLLPVLQVQLRMHRSVIAVLAGRIATLLLTLGVLAIGFGFNAIVAANVIGLGVILLINAVTVHRTISLRPAVDLVYWRRFLRVSLVLGVGLAISQVYFRIDAVLLAVLRPSREVGLYGAAYKFIELTEVFLGAIIVSLVPTLTSLAAHRDPRFGAVSRRAFEMLAAITAPVTLVLLLAPRQLLSLTAGSKYEPAAHALQILAVYPILAGATGLFWRMLIAAHHERLLLGSAVSILVVNVVLNLILIPPYGYKAAAATSIASEAVLLASSFWFVRRRFGFAYPVRPLLSVLPPAAAMALIALVVPAPRIVAVAIGLVVYTAIVVSLPGVVRDTARGFVTGARARFG
jgi:O-antigen/teichoic acid export membrane protein